MYVQAERSNGQARGKAESEWSADHLNFFNILMFLSSNIFRKQTGQYRKSTK